MWLTHEIFLERVKNSNSDYWKEGASYRWEYMSYVIERAKKLGAEKIIEAGASGMPLNDRSYLFDYPLHDLNVIPYHMATDTGGIFIGDKQFDLFIALQVWEHLDKQQEAFAEVMRISKSAILSFPYKWGRGHDARHQGIDDKKIADWTLGIKPISTAIIKQRAVYTWKF